MTQNDASHRAGSGHSQRAQIGPQDEHDRQPGSPRAQPKRLKADTSAAAAQSDAQGREQERGRELRLYIGGLVAALVLTVLPFGLVYWASLPRNTVLITVAVCALAQVVFHFRCFLHISFARQKREDLQLILFSTLLLAIMAGGTLWIMANLATRMHGTGS